MIPDGDPDLTTYLNELLRTNKPEQPNNTFWFPIPKKAGKTEVHTSMQRRIPTELLDMTEIEKLNP